MTVTFEAGDEPPATTNRTAGCFAASAATAATWAGPTAKTTAQRRWTSVAKYGSALPTVASPVTGRYCTLAWVASDASCMPAHTGAAAAPATPCASVSRQAVYSRYGRARGGAAGFSGHTSHTASPASTTPTAPPIQSIRRRSTTPPPGSPRPDSVEPTPGGGKGARRKPGPGHSVRQEHRTDAAVQFLLEHPVSLGPVGQGHRVGGQVLGHQLAALHPLQKHR